MHTSPCFKLCKKTSSVQAFFDILCSHFCIFIHMLFLFSDLRYYLFLNICYSSMCLNQQNCNCFKNIYLSNGFFCCLLSGLFFKCLFFLSNLDCCSVSSWPLFVYSLFLHPFISTKLIVNQYLEYISHCRKL